MHNNLPSLSVLRGVQLPKPMMHIAPILEKLINFTLFLQIYTFHPISANLYISPVFSQNFPFLDPSILTVMHLCIMLYTYWTPLSDLNIKYRWIKYNCIKYGYIVCIAGSLKIIVSK